MIIKIISFILVLSLLSYSAIKSNTGNIHFDSNRDGNYEMTLSNDGLGIGISSPAANLHVSGNAILSNTLSVGDSSSHNSTLFVNGTIGFSLEMLSTNTTLSGNSMILVNSQSGNITLTLPNSEGALYRMYHIKKTVIANEVIIKGGGYIDEQYSVSLSTGNTGALKVISTGIQKWSILTNSGNGQSNSTVASDNLVGWWKFNETSGNVATDSSGEGNNGTINNMAVGNIGVTGKTDLAHDFDGSDDDVSIPDSTSIRPNQNYSVSLWFKPTTVSGTYTHLVAKKGASIISYGIWISNTNKLYFEVNDGSVHGLVGTTTITAGNWHYAVATYDGTDLKIYLNGSLESSTTSAGININYNTNSLFIGSGAFNANFNGIIDDVRIYNYPLTLTEIQLIYSETL